MAEQHFHFSNTSQKIIIEPTEIIGIGGKENPNLKIPIRLGVSPLNTHNQGTQNYQLIGIDATLRVNGLNAPLSKASEINYMKVQHENTCYYSLEFPLDHFRISKVEEKRIENLSITLDQIRIHIGIYESLEIKKGNSTSVIDVISNFLSVSSQPFTVEIPQSQWISKILPAVGYDAIRIIEIPTTSVLINETQKEVLHELKLAKDFFLKGDYDKTVSHCRTAIEPFRKKLADAKKLIESKSEKNWITCITDATDRWLAEVTVETYSMTSKTHHQPSTGHFTRSDAEIIYMISTGIIAYSGKFDPEKYKVIA